MRFSIISMPSSGRERALQRAAERRNVLLVLDDAWGLDELVALDCLDYSTPSKMLVTTHLKHLLTGAPEFSLGVLEPTAAVSLMFEVAGTHAIPPYEPIAYEAAEACGRLPLLLAVANKKNSLFWALPQ